MTQALMENPFDDDFDDELLPPRDADDDGSDPFPPTTLSDDPFAGVGLMGPDIIPPAALPTSGLAVSHDDPPTPTDVPAEEPDLPADVEQVGGYLVNVDTGEVVGHARFNDEYRISSDSTAVAVLEAMMEAESETKHLQELYQDKIDSLAEILKASRRRRDWLEVRFKADLEQFAASRLAGSKIRTLHLFCGKLTFHRSTVLSVVAERKEAAVEWCNRFCREAVKVSVDILIPPLKKRTDLPEELFERVEKDNFSIHTGVK
jgi:hypothetical protein